MPSFISRCGRGFIVVDETDEVMIRNLARRMYKVYEGC